MKCVKTNICNECNERIKAYGELCLDVCYLACLSMTSGEVEIYNPKIDKLIGQIVQFLERKGYLLSSEVSKTDLVFMPTCEPSLIDDNVFVYCWCDL